jgi:hypothetical protein
MSENAGMSWVVQRLASWLPLHKRVAAFAIYGGGGGGGGGGGVSWTFFVLISPLATSIQAEAAIFLSRYICLL